MLDMNSDIIYLLLDEFFDMKTVAMQLFSRASRMTEVMDTRRKDVLEIGVTFDDADMGQITRVHNILDDADNETAAVRKIFQEFVDRYKEAWLYSSILLTSNKHIFQEVDGIWYRVQQLRNMKTTIHNTRRSWNSKINFAEEAIKKFIDWDRQVFHWDQQRMLDILDHIKKAALELMHVCEEYGEIFGVEIKQRA